MMDKPTLGVKPAYVSAPERIAELAGAIQRYAAEGDRRESVKIWAMEILLQLAIWDWAERDDNDA